MVCCTIDVECGGRMGKRLILRRVANVLFIHFSELVVREYGKNVLAAKHCNEGRKSETARH